MRASEFLLLEYIDFSPQKLKARVDSDRSIGVVFPSLASMDVDNISGAFTSWLEQYDPTQNNKYVNWMITRYIKGGIKRIEDIPAKVAPALAIYARLAVKKKLQPEHRDINSFKQINQLLDAVASYQALDIDSQKENKEKIEKAMYENGDAELVYNDAEYKVVIPKTHKASCFFGKNTKWCTTSAESSHYHDMYSKDGPLYIVLHKPTNSRWQMHPESEQFMDEEDDQIIWWDWAKEHMELLRAIPDIAIEWTLAIPHDEELSHAESRIEELKSKKQDHINDMKAIVRMIKGEE